MPFIIKGTAYTLPEEAGSKGITGKELLAIEDYFGLDGLTLLSVFSGRELPASYTQAKALYALAWISLTRAGEIVSLDDVLEDYSPADFVIEDEPENPTVPAESVAD